MWAWMLLVAVLAGCSSSQSVVVLVEVSPEMTSCKWTIGGSWAGSRQISDAEAAQTNTKIPKACCTDQGGKHIGWKGGSPNAYSAEAGGSPQV